MDTKALRQKILDLAIRGKLVPQDPNDEPAEVLLERIREQKQQMLKEGKLKKKDIKNDTIIFKGEDNLHYEKFVDGTVKCIEDEIPFELPEGWAWTRLRVLLNVCSSKRVLKSDWEKEGIPFYRAREIVKLSENGFVNNELFITKKHYLELKKNYGMPQPGDLMVSGVGTIGKVYIVKSGDRFYYKDASVLCFENRNKLLVSKFAKILLESSFIQSQMRDNSNGTTVDTITISTAMNYLCIVPPKNEQTRIVDAVQKALVKVNTIQSDTERLQSTIKNLKSKILDLAIHGKLVPQDPNDEPASVLLKRIRAEKEKLIKQGKIKRDKKESIIFKGDDNSYYERIGVETCCIDKQIPFGIPDNWTWCRLKSLAHPTENSFVDGPFGSNLKTEHYTDSREVRIIQLNNIGDFEWKNAGVRYTTFEHAETLSRCISYPGDIVIAKMMPAGRTIIIPSVEEKFIISSDCIKLRASKRINTKFLMYMINSPSINKCILENVQGIGRTRTSLTKIKELLVPIPPLEEQIRIVQYISKVYGQLKIISESLM